MSKFFSLLSKTIAPIFAPSSEQAPDDRIKESWEIVSQCALESDEWSLADVHNALIDLANDLKDSIGTDSEIDIFAFFAEQKIPTNLVSYGLSDNPAGFSDEVISFFMEFTKKPLISHLFDPYIVKSINSAIENLVPYKKERFNEFLHSLLNCISANISYIDSFIVNEGKSPLFEKIIDNSIHERDGQLLLSVIKMSRENVKLEQLLSKSSNIYKPITSFIQECVVTKTTEAGKHDLLNFINLSFVAMTENSFKCFFESFNDMIFKPLIENAESDVSLVNCIFLLASFQSESIIKPIVQYLEKKLVDFVTSADENVQYLAFRTCTLLLEHANPVISNKYNGRLTSNYMGLFSPDWYVRTTVSDIIPSVRVAVSKSFLSDNKIIWNIDSLMEKIVPIFKELIDLSDKVACSLLEFLSELGANKDPHVSYYVLSNECSGGIYDASSELALTITRRLGSRPGNIENIKLAYAKYESEETDGNEALDGEDAVFNRVVYTLEFFKELNTIVQVKNSFRMNETDEEE